MPFSRDAETNHQTAKVSSAGQRRNAIVTYVLSQEYASVQDLSRYFTVSMTTIRNDLAILEKSGLIERQHGGASIPLEDLTGEIAFQARASMNQEEKKRIGAAAAALVDDSDTIILDSSTTVFYVARNLKGKRDLRVVTNGINTSLELLKKQHTTILVGGVLNEKTYGTVGHLGRNTLSEIRVQKAFFGARGLTLRDGLTDANLDEVELKKAMVEIAAELIVVVDSSKFNMVGFASFAPIQRVSTIVTDDGIDPTLKRDFENIGIKVIIA